MSSAEVCNFCANWGATEYAVKDCNEYLCTKRPQTYKPQGLDRAADLVLRLFSTVQP